MIPGIFILIVVAFVWQSPFLFVISLVSIYNLIKQLTKPPVKEISVATDSKNSLWQRCILSIAYLLLVGGLTAAYSIENSQIASKMPQFGQLSTRGNNPAMTLLMEGGLPEKVPDGKTASEYFTLGFQCKRAGWIEQAREAINRAIATDRSGKIASKAERFLRTRLPRDPVPEKAVLMNITANGENSFFTRDKAEEIWKQCIAEYPKFEWPYGNLGDLYVQEGKYKDAEKLLNRALRINPDYVNAWAHLAECKLNECDKVGAQNCINKALVLEPDDMVAKFIGLKMRLCELFHLS